MAYLNAYAIKTGIGDLDHTYVTSSDGCIWPCFGRSSGGNLIVNTSNTSSKRANSMSQNNSGIVYGIDGVCHQAANRILYFTNQVVSKAGGYNLSVALYGTYGRNILEFHNRVLLAEKEWGDLKPANTSSNSLLLLT